MAENSSIEWTTHTFNPWIRCAKVSAGCKHCYAETLMDTRWGRVEWGVHGTRQRTSPDYWRKPLAWDRQAEGTGERLQDQIEAGIAGNRCTVTEADVVGVLT